ncbi:hypothetical protein C2845_PM01G42380 [Panicum miliaceum]|uniref:Uncharacterized protein n=1 Tax=Panicum miliaceum TaxID=4540 RepID=A0A3L6TS92_PANMI|nr:hypothetical protein C2845_PM01G42380 [Panicum miliaceum]
MINNTSSMSKDDVSQKSRSLYDAQDSEGSEQEEVNKDSQAAKGVRKNTSNHGGNISTRGPRGSKRVVATDREETPIRVTRQRSAVTKQSSKFLQNVGILSSKSSTRVGVSSKVQELQAQLEKEKQGKAELLQEMDSLKLKAQESELIMDKQSQEVDRLKDTIKSQAQQSKAAMAKQSEEIESLEKTVQDCSGFLPQMITFQGQVPPP